MKEAIIICVVIGAMVGIDIGVNIAIEMSRQPYSTVSEDQIRESQERIDQRIDKLFERMRNEE